MKKIGVLSVCIAAVLLLGFLDLRRQGRMERKEKQVWQAHVAEEDAAYEDAAGTKMYGEAYEDGAGENVYGEAYEDGAGTNTYGEASEGGIGANAYGKVYEDGAGENAYEKASGKEIASGGKNQGNAAGSRNVSVDEAEETMIRVMLCTDGYASQYHDSITISSADGFELMDGENVLSYPAGSSLTLTKESAQWEKSDVLQLSASNGTFTLPGLKRESGIPVYEGSLEVRRTEEGLLLINALPLETYLCYVVPSEMPSDYPAEALKAQAVCARTYAKKQMQEGRAAKFFADVDDSVSYQVYNNQGRTPQGDAAVRETKGVVLEEDGELLDALYYSTSCGRSLDMDLSDETVFAAFLSEDNRRAYEAQEPWYRWTAEIDLADFDGALGIEVTKRAQSGRAERIEVAYAEENVTVEGEYQIRTFLDQADPKIVLQDGETIAGMGLLPSAFFVMTPMYGENAVLEGYRLYGGGYGHGEGMSQNGAKGMAQEGMGYREILRSYYGEQIHFT